MNYFTPVEGLNDVLASPTSGKEFQIYPGMEFSQEPGRLPVDEPGGKIVDTQCQGGNPGEMWKPKPGRDLAVDADKPVYKILNKHARECRDHGGIPFAAHPNLTWAFDHEDLLKTDPELMRHLEIYNPEPGMNFYGGGGRPSGFEIWDKVLSQGRVMYGIASDDSHHFDQMSLEVHWANAKPHIQAKANPGQTAIYVDLEELTYEGVQQALENGEFYTTYNRTGYPMKLNSYTVTDDAIQLKLPKVDKDIGWSKPGSNNVTYTTKFIGQGGEILKTSENRSPRYEFTGDELYVRTRVEGSDGGILWTQPVFRNE